MGPNGAGKTTAIKMLTGLLRPTEGSLRVCGHDVVKETRLASLSIGYVPETPFLYDKLSGREFLEFSAEMRGFDRPTVRDRLERESEYFELGDYIDDLIETYSHGMKQRLIFAAALLHDPPVLVVNEPMVGLDPARGASGERLPARAGRRRSGGPDVRPTRWGSSRSSPIASDIMDRAGCGSSGPSATSLEAGVVRGGARTAVSRLHHL